MDLDTLRGKSTMRGNIRWLRPALVAALVAGAGNWGARSAAADSITVKSGSGELQINDAHVSRIENDLVYFTTAQSDTEDSRPMPTVVKFSVDDEPAFSAGEDAFNNKDWKTAADDYSKAITATSKNWVKTRASVRLMEAANRSGNFLDAVKGFLAMADRDPALAAAHRPTIPTDKPDDLDGAIALVKADLSSGTAKVEEQKVLLPFQAQLYTDKGDSAGADQALADDVKIDPDAANSPLVKGARATIAIRQAGDDLKQSKFQDAANLVESHQDVFVDPSQQADALYTLAQAKEGLASKDNPDSLKDAAIAYMRVVAICKDFDGKPHVAESMLKAAAIDEQLQKPGEAIMLYKQVSSTFKDTQPQLADQADAAVQRLQAAKAAH
jgi:TolA-binding protein